MSALTTPNFSVGDRSHDSDTSLATAHLVQQVEELSSERARSSITQQHRVGDDSMYTASFTHDNDNLDGVSVVSAWSAGQYDSCVLGGKARDGDSSSVGDGSVAEELRTASRRSGVTNTRMSAGHHRRTLSEISESTMNVTSEKGAARQSSRHHRDANAASSRAVDRLKTTTAAAGGTRSEEEIAVDHVAELFLRHREQLEEMRTALSRSEYEKQRMKHTLTRELEDKDCEILNLKEALQASRDETLALQRSRNVLEATSNGAEAELGIKAETIKRLTLDLADRDREIRSLKGRLYKSEQDHGDHHDDNQAMAGQGSKFISKAKDASEPHTTRGPQVVITGFRGREKQELERYVESLHGSVVSSDASKRLPSTVTHVIAGSLTPKVISGLLTDGVWVMPAGFVYNSLREEVWLPEEPYQGSARGSYNASVEDLRGRPVFVTPKESKDPGNQEVLSLLRQYGIRVCSAPHEERDASMTLTQFVEHLRPAFLRIAKE